jgi:ribonuclease R
MGKQRKQIQQDIATGDERKQYKDDLLVFINSEAYVAMKKDELAQVMEVEEKHIPILEKALAELTDEGLIAKSKKGRYISSSATKIVRGKFRSSGRGFGFVISDDKEEDVFIAGSNANGAMNDDIVLAKVTKESITFDDGRSKKKREGEIYKIVTRGTKQIVGTFQKSKNFAFVIPDNKRFGSDVYIPMKYMGKAKDGDKVVAEITVWPKNDKRAEGKITEVLGNYKEPGVDILSVIYSFGIPIEFPPEVIVQVEKVKQGVTSSDIGNRRDLREQRLVTIDGEDAKDLDDAVSIQVLDNGLYRLGVHIADVSNYVKENTPLDDEAFNRGTSVYFADRVIPMLPEKLSNGICSLNENVDRLAFSVTIDIDRDGNIMGNEIFESVICVKHRMTYNDVYNILENNVPKLLEKYGDYCEDFKLMKELSLILKSRRDERGSIDFDFPEARIILNEEGIPIEIRKREMTIANKIIEEFMLLCNETVAERFAWLEIPFVYRIHEEPDIEKIGNFLRFATSAGVDAGKMTGAQSIHPQMFRKILEKIKGTEKEKIISTMLLRSLKKARYSDINAGHFGLSSKCYCHFTSPIRRYPDLQIHRIMKEHIHGTLSEDRINYYASVLSERADHCSEREVSAEEAEREVEDIKKAEFMKQFIGDVFDGIISGVTGFGMFIELDNTVEGLIRLDNMNDDYYNYDEVNLKLTGEHTGKTYQLGDKIKVVLVSVNVNEKQIDFCVYDSEAGDQISLEKPKYRPKSKRNNSPVQRKRKNKKI